MKTALAVAVFQLLSCGGSKLPECPTGNCTLPGRTIVKWTFDHYPDWLFESDTCIDMGATTVHIDVALSTDPSVTASLDASCSDAQGTFSDLVPGTYNVAITPVDGDGNAIVNAPATGQVVAADPGAITDATVNVPYTAWTKTYTGTLLFRLSWAGLSCEAASPHVAIQQLKLLVGGHVVHAMTDDGQQTDGQDDKPCRSLSEQFAQFVKQLPFGPITLQVVGKDMGNSVRFEHQFDTFVGAGSNNPTITFDVPGPDASLDAPQADAPAADAAGD